jgi:hypothetical protein
MVTRYHDLEPRKATIITEALQESVIYMIQVVHTYDSAEDMIEGIREFMLEWSDTAEGQEALAMAEGAKQAAEQKAKSAQLAREMWDDYYKLYGHKARGESQGVVRSFPTPGFTETKTGLLVPEGTYAG